MPILEVEIVGTIPNPAGIATRLADALGETLDSGPQGTWVKVRYLSPDNYAENQGGPEKGVLPVFVSILQSAVPTGKSLKVQTMKVAEVVASLCHRSQANVHIIYEASAFGRIAFGGVLRSLGETDSVEHNADEDI